MEYFEQLRIKWSYVTHLVDRTKVAGLLPPVAEMNPGSLVLGRVLVVGKHRDIEGVNGRRQMLFPGDVFAGVLGHRYATDQFEGTAHCSGATGHILGIGGVCGEVVTKNTKMVDPTTVEWLGRLAGPDGQPLNLREFCLRPERGAATSHPMTILSVGASMNSGKTTLAAHLIRFLSGLGRRVAAAKLTGTACRKDLGMFEDAGAVRVLDFTHCGHPSTAGASREELLAIPADLRAELLTDQPDYIVYEIADGLVQRETRILLEEPEFREAVDAVTFAGADGLSCESGVRMLRALGCKVLAAGGIVSSSPLGIAEVEAATGVSCLSSEMILTGVMKKEVLRQLLRAPAARRRARGMIPSGGDPAPDDKPTAPEARR